MEVFGAFNKSATTDTEVPSYLFTDHAFDGETVADDYVFYERSVSLVHSDRSLYAEAKQRISIQELYTGNYGELNQKSLDGKHDFPFFIKTYAAPDNLMLINKHIEIIGFLNLPQEFEPIEKPKEIYFHNEIEPVLHPYYMPVIHAFRVKHVEAFVDLPASLQEIPTNKSTFNRMAEFATQVARGDATFGRLMLYSIVSLVTNRPYNSPIDFFSLNLYNVTSDSVTQDIKRFARLLSPRPFFQSITLSEVAKTRLYGKKNYEYNCIEQGIPLEDGTTLVLDETQLEIGTLYEVAVKNVTMLNNIIGLQKRYYDFDYCPFEADCNCTVLGLSRGRSILEFEHKVMILS